MGLLFPFFELGFDPSNFTKEGNFFQIQDPRSRERVFTLSSRYGKRAGSRILDLGSRGYILGRMLRKRSFDEHLMSFLEIQAVPGDGLKVFQNHRSRNIGSNGPLSMQAKTTS